MDQETVGMIARNRFAQLLQGPGCGCIRGDVAMYDASCPDLHQEEHIESSKPSGWGVTSVDFQVRRRKIQ